MPGQGYNDDLLFVLKVVCSFASEDGGGGGRQTGRKRAEGWAR